MLNYTLQHVGWAEVRSPTYALTTQSIGHSQENDMTQLLNQAFQEASKLPDMQQNMIARWLLDELLSEKKWDKSRR